MMTMSRLLRTTTASVVFHTLQKAQQKHAPLRAVARSETDLFTAAPYI